MLTVFVTILSVNFIKIFEYRENVNQKRENVNQKKENVNQKIL